MEEGMEDQQLTTNPDRYSLTIGFSSSTAASAGKYYYNSDRIRETEAANEEEVDDLYAENALPTMRALVDSCIQEGYSIEGDTTQDDDENQVKLIWNKAKQQYQANWFHKGDWVEYRGLDMEWKLAQIRRVILQAPDSWDYDENDGEEPPPQLMNVYYSFREQGLIPQELVRAPKEGLETLFGSGPWLWQQHCLLLLERRLRFQEGHEYDFEELDIQRFADRRFDAWVHATGNERFREHFYAQPEIAQRLLATHLLTPFELMDQITEDDDEWDFEDPDISIYTYTGVLGSGCSMFLIALTIQILGIFVLFMNGVQTEDGEPNQRFNFDDPDEIVTFLGFQSASTNITKLCRGQGFGESRNGYEGKILLFLVILMYLCQIVPDSFQRFYRVAGAYSGTHSKINSLREIIYTQADDSLLQQIGYKTDRYMNTAFVCIVYMVLLFILFNTPNVLDIILNALAVEYLYQIDENLADAEWLDRGNRWIKAGTQQLVIQGTLRLQILENVDRICAEYDIDKAKYKEALGDNFGPLKGIEIAQKDDKNPVYMSKKERLWHQFGEYAKRAGNDQALAHFVKGVYQFGLLERVLYVLGFYREGIYHRFIEYRCWSRWEKVLYLAHVPDELEKDGEIITKRSALDMEEAIAHVERSDLRDFVFKVIRVFTFIEFLKTIRLSLSVGSYYEIPWRIVDGILQYISFTLQITFPFFVLAALVIFPYCY